MVALGMRKARAVSWWPGGSAATPSAVLSSIGHTAPKAITATFMPSPIPSSTMNSGRSTGGGSARRKARAGARSSRAVRHRPIEVPTLIPITAAITHPDSSRATLGRMLCVQASTFVAHRVQKCAATSLNVGQLTGSFTRSVIACQATTSPTRTLTRRPIAPSHPPGCSVPEPRRIGIALTMTVACGGATRPGAVQPPRAAR
jgi:hypothetical protein